MEQGKYSISMERLSTISNLKENWNGFNAQPFSKSLIKRCRDIILKLDKESDIICPIPNGTIQIEYRKEVELEIDYLEFTIDHHNKIEVYADLASKGVEIEKRINSIEEMNAIIDSF